MKSRGRNKVLDCLFKFTFILAFIFTSFHSVAQVQLSTKNRQAQTLTASFIGPEITFEKGEMISNVLVVKNQSSDTATFTIDLTCPSIWRTLLNTQKLYTIYPGDSIFIPVRILPFNIVKGNTKYFINAYLVSEDSRQLAFAYFFAFTQKNINWELQIYPANRNYLLYDESSFPFSVNLHNKGTELQEILYSFEKFGHNILLTDSMGKPLKRNSATLVLDVEKDTTFHYIFNYKQLKRNYFRIGLENYNPFYLEDESKYSIYYKSTVPKKSENNNYSSGKRVDFIKLAETKKVNPFGSKVLPLTMDANIYNLVNENPMMSVDFRGAAALRNNSFLLYGARLFFHTNYYTNQYIANAPFYVGYYTKRYKVEYNDSRYYRNLNGYYIIDGKQSVAAYINQGPSLFRGTDFLGVGANYSYSLLLNNQWLSGIDFNGFASRWWNFPSKMTNDQLGVSARMRVYKFSLGLSVVDYRLQIADTSDNKVGYSVDAGYSDNFFDQKLNTSISASYSKNIGYYTFFSSSGKTDVFRLQLNNSYSFKPNQTIVMTNQFYQYPGSYEGSYINNRQFTNQLLYSPVTQYGNFSSGLFYNIIDLDNYISHSRGAILGFGKYNFETRNRYYSNITAGYNGAPHEKNYKNYFFLRYSFMASWRTLAFNCFYSYGHTGLNRNTYRFSTRYPQAISMSLSYQYVFPFPAVVAESRLSYTYSNVTGHLSTFSPELYYFTKSGWRFKVNPEFAVSRSNPAGGSERYYFNKEGETQKLELQWNRNVSVNVGIRKEFGIPIPWAKIKYCTPDFIAFLDENGNKIHDPGEQVLDNVVVHLNGWEVITNKKGKAKLENIETGKYPFTVFSLVDLEGWFPHTEDSLHLFKSETVFVPFAKGIKIYGGIVLDREKYGIDKEQKIDLSKIKVMASNGKIISTLTDYHGAYAMYLPYGKYTLTMDETLLGDRFSIVENNFEITIDEKIDNLYIPFYIVEKKRKLSIKKFDNKSNAGETNGPDMRKKKEEEEKLRKKKEEEDRLKKQQEEDRLKKQQEEERLRKLKEEEDKKKKEEGNKNVKTKDGIIDITANGEVTASDIDKIKADLLNKMGGKDKKAADNKNKAAENKDKNKDKKENKDNKDKPETKEEPYVAKDVSSLKDLNRKINKDDFLDVEIDGLLYRIQVAASNAEVPAAWLKNQFNIQQDVYLFKNDDGMMNYCLGDFTTKGEAMIWSEKFSKQKRMNCFITYYYNNKRVPYQVIEGIYQAIIDQINQEKEQGTNPQQENELLKQHSDSLKKLQEDTIKLLKDTLDKK